MACLVFARRFLGERRGGWAAYSLASAVAYLVLGFAAFPAEDFRLMLVGGAVIWLWASAIAVRLLVAYPRRFADPGPPGSAAAAVN